jgi:glucose/arabinose dehydrogenase
MLTRKASLIVILIAALALAPTVPAAAQERTARAPDLRTVKVVDGDQVTAFAFTPRGRIWYVEKASGQIRVASPRQGTDRRFATITNVDSVGERGALGIALHPRWPKKPFVYVYVSRSRDGVLGNELLRIRVRNGRPASMSLLFRWRVLRPSHSGGRIVFGPDRMLYVITGDNGDPATSQQLGNLRGKILRIAPNGGIPEDNPWATRVWAYGIRNSFGMAFDPRTDRLWQTENGPECNDEINLIRRAGNYAWGPSWRCSTPPTAADTNRDGANRIFPRYRFPAPLGITGATFCDGCRLGPRQNGALLFGQVRTPEVWALDMNAARTGFAGAPRRVVGTPTVVYSMESSPRGRVFFSGPGGIWRIARA